jgi:pimeloyl-ACP methyl ester carboxylesterase
VTLPPLARLALAVSVCLCLVAGCHILAVPVASSVARLLFPATTPAAEGLVYREVLLCGAQGVRLPAWRVESADGTGKRGTVLLLAENGGNRASPRILRLAREVSAMGFDALLVDLRGHGQSSGVNTYGLGETLDLMEVLRELREEDPTRRIAAVGFSLGAACILRAMSMTDAIEAAAVFAPYSALDPDFIRHELVYQASGRRGGALARLFSARLLLASIHLWAGFPRLPEPMDLATDRPVLLFHCSGDPEVPFSHARAIAAHARAPGLELHVVSRNEHLPPLSDAEVWEGFASALRELLDRSLPPGEATAP